MLVVVGRQQSQSSESCRVVVLARVGGREAEEREGNLGLLGLLGGSHSSGGLGGGGGLGGAGGLAGTLGEQGGLRGIGRSLAGIRLDRETERAELERQQGSRR